MAKGVIITKENYNMVIGKLKRFFRNRHIVVWHDFDVGMRKRIPTYFKKRRFLYPRTEQNEYGFLVRYGDHNAHYFRIGSEVWFLGNRIITKEKWDASNNKKYLYMCWQIGNNERMTVDDK